MERPAGLENRRTYLHVSLRALLVLITIICIGTALGVQLYEARYARNRRAHHYFESLEIGVVVGDPCPPGFVYYVDGTCRNDGLKVTDTPDWIDRFCSRRLSYPSVRELNFRNKSPKRYRFRFDLALADKITELAPEVESIQFPQVPELWKQSDSETVDAIVGKMLKLKELRVASFSQWPVTDDHIRQLAALENLSVVQLAHSSKITNRSFASFREMKRLRFLTIQSGVSNDAAQAFHNDRPDVIMYVNGVAYGDESLLYMNRKNQASGS